MSSRPPSRQIVLSVFAGVLLGTGATAFVAGGGGSAYYTDVSVNDYFNEAAGDLYQARIMQGVNGKFNPAGIVNRAELAVVIQRLRDEFYGVDGTSKRARTRSRPAASTASAPVAAPATASSAATSQEGAGAAVSATSASRKVAGPSFRFTTGKYSVDESKAEMQISVIRTGGNKGTATVEYTATAGTATAEEDFELVSGTLSFADGETSKIFIVKIVNDSVTEGGETIALELKNPTGIVLGTPASATLTIKDDESAAPAATSSAPATTTFAFSASAYEVSEKGGSLTVTVLRAGPAAGSASVNYATSNGTAKSSDYTAANGTLSFASGETSKTFLLSITDDTSIDGNKTVNLTLTAPTGGATLGNPAAAVVTISDDEIGGTSGAGSFLFTDDEYRASEGDGLATITVRRTGGAVGTVTVDYRTSDGTAKAAEDYTATLGTLTFLVGEVKKIFVIPIVNDAISDPEEKLNLTLGTPTGGASLGTPSNAVLTIFE